jgi:S1-C subfamily serine protease
VSSLFDDHRTPPPAWPLRPSPPPDTLVIPEDPPPVALRRRFAPAVIGLLVAAGILVGLAIGREAWPSGAVGPVASSGGASPPSRFGSSGSGGYLGRSGYGGGAPSAGGSPAASASASPAAQALAAKVDPTLVDIESTFAYRGDVGAGTGIVLTPDGEILTNNHVVNGAGSIKVTDVGNGRSYQAKVVGYDVSEDIAVLQLENASGLQAAKLGDSTAATVGAPVVALGNAGGSGGTPSMAAGSITALGRSITASDGADGSSERLSGLIEVDANVQPGDSGGPLVNGSGEVIGVDTAASAGFSFQSTAGQGFAIPINRAMDLARQIESGQASATVHVGPTALLGVLTSGGTSQPGQRRRGLGGYGYGYGAPPSSVAAAGAVVAQVADASAAQRAGLVAGDVITSINGQAVDSPRTLSKLIIALKPGDTVTLHWTDGGGQARSASVALGSGPPA